MKLNSRKTLMFIMTSLALIFSAVGVTPVYAATTITVNNTNDSGPGSLRDAISNAGPGDTIDFTAGLSGATITLASSLTLSADVTIDGSALASQIIISGNNTVRVFAINFGANVTLNSLGISNGNSGLGGGVSNGTSGTLKVMNSTFTQNSSNNGGAIYNNTGDLIVINSVFYGNTADYGGAIYSSSSLTVTNSTFSGNIATDPGGGVGGGGAIYSTGGFIKNSTFSGNSASTNGGAINNQDGNLAITNSTFYNNFTDTIGGAIYTFHFATMTIVENSTFAFNAAASGGGIYAFTTLAGAPFNYANTIISNSISGGDCVVTGAGGIGVNTNNLVEDGSCSAGVSGNPKLGLLSDNGGPTETMALLSGSPAIDAGDDVTCAAAPVNNLDQRSVTRPQSTHCDIGAYEYIEPAVVSITRASANLTDAASVDYTVMFSVPVTNVDATDFTVTKIGAGNISGMAVSGVSGSGDTYTVTVDTGSGTGRLRLDVLGSIDITDLNGNPLINVPYVSGDIYMIVRAAILKSNGPQDGWILESSAGSGTGGALNSTATTLNIGDDPQNRQFRAILSFDTSSLPDNATITDVRLRVRVQGVVGTINTLGGPNVDIRSDAFGALPTLQPADFQNPADAAMVLDTSDAQANNWYRAVLSNAAYSFVNVTGTTQIRLYFNNSTNNDNSADFIRIFSGNAAAANRPQLIVQYTVP